MIAGIPMRKITILLRRLFKKEKWCIFCRDEVEIKGKACDICIDNFKTFGPSLSRSPGLQNDYVDGV